MVIDFIVATRDRVRNDESPNNFTPPNITTITNTLNTNLFSAVKLKTFRSWRVLAGACKVRRIPHPHQTLRPFQSTPRIANMAAIQLDDKAKSLITKTYPQANESDPVKLSSAVFPTAEVSVSL